MGFRTRVKVLTLPPVAIIMMIVAIQAPSRCAMALQRRVGASSFRHHRPSTTTRCSTQLFSTQSSQESNNNNHNNKGLWLPNHTTPIRSIAAPMVAASDYAFRCLCRQYGVDLTFTQMLHAKNICVDSSFRANHFDFAENNEIIDFHSLPSQETYLQGYDATSLQPSSSWNRDFHRGPVIVQLAGNDPEQVVEAANRVLEHSPGVSGFDLNCGCPQMIAKKGNYGAFLAESDNAHRICTILEALRRNLPAHVAVSAKIRLPLDPTQLDDRITRLVNTGIDFLTIHGRTIKENKTLVRASHSDTIRQAVDIAHRARPQFPVVANGGVESLEHVDQILQATNAVAIMSSEGLLETPQIFRDDTTLYTPRQRLETQFQITRDYMYWTTLFPPHPGVMGSYGGSFGALRQHLFKFLHRYLQEHTDLRDRLANPRLNRLEQGQEIVNELYSRYENMSDEELERMESSQPGSSWYRRHWSANAEADARKKAPPRDQLSIEERKRLAYKRIQKLRQQRLEKEQDANVPAEAVG